MNSLKSCKYLFIQVFVHQVLKGSVLIATKKNHKNRFHINQNKQKKRNPTEEQGQTLNTKKRNFFFKSQLLTQKKKLFPSRLLHL
jgi:hypothetical protein